MLKHVLTPRVKATHIAFDCMKNYLDAVYDVTVAFEGTVDDKGQRKEAPSMIGESAASPAPCVSPDSTGVRNVWMPGVLWTSPLSGTQPLPPEAPAGAGLLICVRPCGVYGIVWPFPRHSGFQDAEL